MRERDARSIGFTVRKVLRSDACLQHRRAKQRCAKHKNHRPIKKPHTSHNTLRCAWMIIREMDGGNNWNDDEYPRITPERKTLATKRHRKPKRDFPQIAKKKS